MESKACRTCGGIFNPTRYWQHFCGTECRIKYHSRIRRLANRLPELCDELVKAGHEDAAKFVRDRFSDNVN